MKAFSTVAALAGAARIWAVPSFAGPAGGAFAPETPDALPMERAAWEKYHPLGGEFENGRYATPRELAPSFEVSRLVPPSSNLVFEASFTPARKAGKGNGTAAIAVFESPGRYWNLGLFEDRPGTRSFVFSEQGGASQIHAALAKELDVGAGASWEWGRTYRLRLVLDGSGAEGEVRDAETGGLLFRRRHALAPGHVRSGRPAFKFNRILGEFAELRASASGPVPDVPGGLESGAPPVPGGAPARFYRTERDAEGYWWFVDPDGWRFFLSGIGVVTHAGHYSAALGHSPYGRTVARKYPTLEDWATNTLSRIRSWGFNFLSSSSALLLRRGLPHAHVVNIGQNFSCYGDEFDLLPCDGGPCSGFPNVFHPLFPEYCRFRARAFCSGDRDDPWTLGWYIDNELSWWGDRRKFATPPARGLFDAAARKAPDHPARKALDAFLAGRGLSSPEEADEEATRAFVRLVARRYFEIASSAIREADPNHLILGCRFAGFGSSDPVVWEECGRFCDAVSVNSYPMVDLDRGIAVTGFASHDRPIADILRERAKLAGKPVIMTEWGFSALDSGLPCTHGAGQRFFTQRERAEATSVFARTMWSMPEVGGYVYFMWCDQPAVGKNGPKSENTNYGLVNADDEPYAEQVAALAAVQCHPEHSRHAEAPRERRAAAVGAAEMAEVLSHAEDAEDAEFEEPFLRVEGGRAILGGKGAFSVMVRETSRGAAEWSVAREASPPAGPSGDTLVLRGPSAAGGAFEAVVRFHRPEGKPFVLAELLSLRNTGGKPLPFDAFYFRLLPSGKEARDGAEPLRGDDAFAPPREGQPTPIPPMLWRPWRSAAWVLPDGTVLGMLAPRATGVDVRFRKDSTLHGDAECPVGRRTLDPGAEWTPGRAPYVVAAAIPGGEEAWRAFCAGIRAAAPAAAGPPPPVTTTVHPDRAAGPVKPVNGVGQPPILGLRRFSMFHYLSEAGIPFSRLHDTGGPFGRGVFVDIPNLFRDFDADETDPSNYDFAFTDRLVEALAGSGVEPFFRLGVTIENYADVRRYRIDPPKDFAKWARICEHVVRHYTEGWAGGFRHEIRHWEIWNEPDNWDDPERNEMWHGEFADYCRLYDVASKHLKAAFPHLLFGGPASCGVAYLTGWDTPRARHHLDCFGEFLRFVRENGSPLDFFSWHGYSSVENTLAQARYIRERLDGAGFAGVPSVLDEWLPEPDHSKMGTARQAAEIAAGLVALQNGPVDSAAIYDAKCGVGKYSPLFNPLTYEPHKAYYAFLAFNELRKLGTAAETRVRENGGPLRPGVFAAAAAGGGAVAALVVNAGDEAVPFELAVSGGAEAVRCRIVDDERTWDEIPLPSSLPPHSFLLASVTPETP